ncbi:MAG TPA: ATP-binding cassette domain-containing protein [Chloroflexota bacterium]|nr:ATP-binding cassette domain-containing protein [Chloroflexota bacterium]
MDSIRVEHLVKRYGSLTAVDGISFTVAEGELFGFLGPNGAGKSTTIHMLCTLLRPTEGRAWVAGLDVAAEATRVRRAIGLIFQDPSLDDRLTALENLDFHARIYNLPRAVWRERSEQLLRMVDLWDRRNDLVRTFSGGMKRRLEIARGLLHQPAVFFLDEPTIGLDPQTREHIWRYLLDLRRREGVTLFLTTHYMDEAERCDRIAIIDHGHIVALDTPDALKAGVGGDVVTLRTADADQAAANLQARFGLAPSREDGTLRLEVPGGEQFIPRLVTELGVPIQAISVHRPTLEDVFLKLTGSAMRDEEGGAWDAFRARIRSGWNRGR